MDMQRRRDVPSEVHALAGANAALRSDKARLEKDIGDLKALTERLEQKARSLQVAVALLLATTLGLAVGLTTSMTGSGVPAALGSATGVFFAVIMTSIAVLTYIRR
jgi:cysteine sulfinate desulfinase/cysteine desulfurase-like protein